MAATPSIKIVKQMNYRGGTRLFSNRYHFNGGFPADNAHFVTFADAVVAAEKAIYEAVLGTEIVEAAAYPAGSDIASFVKTYSVVGTGAFADFVGTPGECAALIRWSTTAKTSKNHPIYLFSYYHDCGSDNVHGRDELDHAQKSAMETYATDWITGFSDGSNTYVRAGPNGATGTARVVDTYITHRDFPK